MSEADTARRRTAAPESAPRKRRQPVPAGAAEPTSLESRDGGEGNARPVDRKVMTWVQDPIGVRRNILDVAREEFVEKGLSGARVDNIAARTSTSKRMIYYYFTDKEGLYRAVLAESYTEIRALERSIDLAALSPAEAMAALVGVTFDYHADHPDFVRLVMVENIHHARHLRTMSNIRELNSSAIGTVREIYGRGVESGAFRPGIEPMDIHLTVSALSFYNVSNRATIQQIFQHDMSDMAARQRRRQSVIDTVLRFVSL
jgi:AcrR family transcriptional regulator